MKMRTVIFGRIASALALAMASVNTAGSAALRSLHTNVSSITASISNINVRKAGRNRALVDIRRHERVLYRGVVIDHRLAPPRARPQHDRQHPAKSHVICNQIAVCMFTVTLQGGGCLWFGIARCVLSVLKQV